MRWRNDVQDSSLERRGLNALSVGQKCRKPCRKRYLSDPECWWLCANLLGDASHTQQTAKSAFPAMKVKERNQEQIGMTGKGVSILGKHQTCCSSPLLQGEPLRYKQTFLGHRHFYYCAIKPCPGRFKALLVEVAVSVVKEASNLSEEII